MTCKPEPPSLQVGDRIWLHRPNVAPLPGKIIRFMGYRQPVNGWPGCTLWQVECYTADGRTVRFYTPKPSYRLEKRYLAYTTAEKESEIVK